jgi:hypothetical protein
MPSTNCAASSCLVSAGDLVGNSAVLTQFLVILAKPGLRQVQPSIKQGRSLPARIAQENASLTVVLFPCGSALLGVTPAE